MLHARRASSSTAMLFALSCALLSPSPAESGEPDLRRLLERPILTPRTALEEVQRFTEGRVPRLPAFDERAGWEKFAERTRREVLERVVFRGRAREWRDAETRVEWLETLAGGAGYRIRKVRYEALPGMWIPALLYEPERLEGSVPVVLNVNGHDGKGKAAPYKQIRCIHQAKHAMLALNVEWFGMGQLRSEGFVHYTMNQLDLAGTSGLAPFYLAMKRGIDLLLAHPHADPERVAVAGLSGGGWQTIVISSLDTRVALANPVAGYSSFLTRARHLSDLGDSEQTPSDLATVADYTHLTALRAPRPTLLTYNAQDDCCFASPHALPALLEAAGPAFALYGAEDRLRWHVNHDPGTHNFERENREAFYRMLGEHFFGDGEACLPEDPTCGVELRSAEELAVELPPDNKDFHALALETVKDLPRAGAFPEEGVEIPRWRGERVAELAALLRTRRHAVGGERVGTEAAGRIEATWWKLHLGSDWTVPAVELARGSPERTALVVADVGRAGARERVEALLSGGFRVVAMDPFYFGESRVAERDFLFALLVAAVGERPLGVQASQVAAVARWLALDRRLGPVTVVASGPRSSLFALAGAAVEERAIGSVRLEGSHGSLKELIEANGRVDRTPELFAFGLLERFDILGIAALVAPREVVFENATDRAREELAGLQGWYERLGRPFDPLRPR